MTGSGVIDVTVGLVLVFFLLSLICSGLNEFVAGIFNMRARFLTNSLGKLLGPDLQKALYNHPLIRGLSRTDVPTTSQGQPPAEPRKKPSYIPAKTFALALQSLLAAEAKVPKAEGEGTQAPQITLATVKSGLDALQPVVRDALTAVTGDVTESLDAWRTRVETWYEETMSRVSGWYKRRIRGFILVFAVLVTLALNADAVRIVVTLWRDKSVRDSVVARVEAVQATPIPCPTPSAPATSPAADPLDLSCVTERIHDVEDLKLPLGWPAAWPSDWNAKFPDDRRVPHDGGQWALKILGLAITIAAISRGAPFWFDLLNRLGNFRSAARPPATGSPTG